MALLAGCLVQQSTSSAHFTSCFQMSISYFHAVQCRTSIVFLYAVNASIRDRYDEHVSDAATRKERGESGGAGCAEVSGKSGNRCSLMIASKSHPAKHPFALAHAHYLPKFGNLSTVSLGRTGVTKHRYAQAHHSEGASDHSTRNIEQSAFFPLR